MKVIAGTVGGRRLKTPKGYKTRPTSARVKEAIFSSIASLIPGASFLDLFAGAGGIGIEALSRGASHCTFVERWPQAFSCLEYNLKQLCFKNSSLVVKDDAMNFINKGLNKKYNIVFLDPPYEKKELLITILKKINNLLEKEGIVIVETESKYSLPMEYAALQLTKMRRYGDTQVGFYKLQ
jgi:16S rRNA (guanine966-N2)-methyltransferase